MGMPTSIVALRPTWSVYSWTFSPRDAIEGLKNNMGFQPHKTVKGGRALTRLALHIAHDRPNFTHAPRMKTPCAWGRVFDTWDTCSCIGSNASSVTNIMYAKILHFCEYTQQHNASEVHLARWSSSHRCIRCISTTDIAKKARKRCWRSSFYARFASFKHLDTMNHLLSLLKAQWVSSKSAGTGQR